MLEIVYLDTSPGTELNMSRWPDEAKDKDAATLGPIIYLLYSPDHYDILYRDAIPQLTQPPAASTLLQVNRVAAFTHQYEIQSTVPSFGFYSTLNLSPLALLTSFEPPGFAPLGSPSPISPSKSAYSPSPQSTWVPQLYADSLSSAPCSMSSTHSTHSQPSPQPQSQDTWSLTSLRFSKHMFPVPGMVENNAYDPEPTFQLQTNIFKHSFYSTAHYNNPHFQPEEYKPDQDDEIPLDRIGVRKRDS